VAVKQFSEETVIFGANLVKKNFTSGSSWLFRATLCGALVVLVLCPVSFGQSPIPAVTGPARDKPEGFTTGWTLGTKFEGSYSSDGAVYDVGSALGYNFSRHFGIDAGVPLYFVTTPTTIKKNNPGAVSGIGVGTFFTDLRWNYPNPSLNFSSAVHLTAPTGETKKGLSNGHATWNLANHIDRLRRFLSVP
jgi:hypothetical protein